MSVAQSALVRSTPTKPRRTIGRFVLVLMALAAFGPYLSGSVRSEQAVVYVAAALVAPFAVILFRPRGGLPVFLAMAGILAVSLIGVIAPPRGFMPFEQGNLLAGFDNLALPIAVMVVVWSLVSTSEARNVFTSASKVIIWGAVLNGIAALISTRIDTSPWLRIFWSGEDGTTTAENAVTMGRFSGVFNHPAEAGIVYGLAMILAVYIYHRRPVLMYLALALIASGGMVSVSKVIVVVGLPLVFFLLWKTGTLRRRTSIIFLAPIGLIAILQSNFIQGWDGFDFLARLVSPPDSQTLLEFYSAGRFAEGSTLVGVFQSALDENWLSGVGTAGWAVAYDSGWTEVVIVAGLLGVAMHAAVFVLLFVYARRISFPRLRLTFTVLVVFLAAADLGISAFTANRVATLVWLVLALLVLVVRQEQRERVAGVRA